MSKKEKIMPALVLTIVCIIITGLLVAAYNLTYVDNTGVLTPKLKTACVDIFGEADYKIITKTDEDGKLIALQYGDVKNVIVDKVNGNCLFEVISKGYAKDGIDIVVGIDKDGKVKGVKVIALKETPGLGTKVDNASFLERFNNAGSSAEVDAVDGISGATYSSKGMRTAVKAAIDAYTQHKEEIFGE